jgi:hypothetical protein
MYQFYTVPRRQASIRLEWMFITGIITGKLDQSWQGDEATMG